MAAKTHQLSAKAVFAQLSSADPLRAWRTIARAKNQVDQLVALDYAEEHGILPHELIEAMRSAERLPKPALTNPQDGSELIWVPPGKFLVGEEQLPAEAEGFLLARYPVTNQQYLTFLEATDYEPDDVEDYLNHWSGPRKFAKKIENHPVTWVSLIDALRYCEWAEVMLPTEWLWEKAARGEDGRNFPWGNDPPIYRAHWGAKTLLLAHIRDKSTCPVSKFAATRSPYGCEQLIGNVSEWCLPGDVDNYVAIPATWPLRKSGGVSFHYGAVRGSAYMRKQIARMTSHHRRKLAVTRRNYWTGFRTALLPMTHPTDG